MALLLYINLPMAKPVKYQGPTQITASALTPSLLDFIAASPTPFHAVKRLKGSLSQAGFTHKTAGEPLPTEPGNQMMLSTNDSALIAISINAPIEQGFRILGAHTDSPCLKVKPESTYVKNGFLQLGVEVYGGMLMNPWFDRDLSLAGRVTVQLADGELKSFLIDFKRPIATVPSLAIHLDRNANKERTVNAQDHLPPLLCRIDEDKADFDAFLLAQIESEHAVKATSVMGFELSLYDTQRPAVVGLNHDFIASARLDNLLSTFICSEAIRTHTAPTNTIVVLNDHEEVGSSSTSGAAGPFLASVLRQLTTSESSYRQMLDHSMLISVDNAHSIHPNYADKHEPQHQPLINKGPVIKLNANQRYATNSETQAVFASLCQANDIPFQQFVVRSDLGCGSTIGPITATELGARTLDIGVPQLAMHSIRELAGVNDVDYLYASLSQFTQLENLPWTD